jgi:hypothetical protein
METELFLASKEVKAQKSSSKLLASIFREKDTILLVDYLEKVVTITGKYNVALLDKLKQQLVSKLQGKLSKGIVLLQENAAPHKATIIPHKLAYLHTEVLKHQTYSPDMAPSDYTWLSTYDRLPF